MLDMCRIGETHAAAAWSWVEKMFCTNILILRNLNVVKSTHTGRPSHFSAERSQCLNEDSSLDSPWTDDSVKWCLQKRKSRPTYGDILQSEHQPMVWWGHTRQIAPKLNGTGIFHKINTFFLMYINPGISCYALSQMLVILSRMKIITPPRSRSPCGQRLRAKYLYWKINQLRASIRDFMVITSNFVDHFDFEDERKENEDNRMGPFLCFELWLCTTLWPPLRKIRIWKSCMSWTLISGFLPNINKVPTCFGKNLV